MVFSQRITRKPLHWKLMQWSSRWFLFYMDSSKLPWLFLYLFLDCSITRSGETLLIFRGVRRIENPPSLKCWNMLGWSRAIVCLSWAQNQCSIFSGAYMCKFQSPILTDFTSHVEFAPFQSKSCRIRPWDIFQG